MMLDVSQREIDLMRIVTPWTKYVPSSNENEIGDTVIRDDAPEEVKRAWEEFMNIEPIPVPEGWG